jgi:NAD(P)-dependent dehydrogenase (short-subunit alcohol dehydrogenase family)
MTDLNLTGRTALVTGASRGIGRGIALALAKAGADIAVNYTRDGEAAAETVAAIAALGRKAKAYQASVADEDASAAMIAAIAADFGPLSILINNAGVASRGKAVADTDADEVEKLLAIHAVGAHRISRLCLPQLRQHDRSDIIVISSVATLGHAANGAPYNMAKAAGEALALTLAKEEVRNGVRVNIVAPSLTVSDMGERLARFHPRRCRRGGALVRVGRQPLLLGTETQHRRRRTGALLTGPVIALHRHCEEPQATRQSPAIGLAPGRWLEIASLCSQ